MVFNLLITIIKGNEKKFSDFENIFRSFIKELSEEKMNIMNTFIQNGILEKNLVGLTDDDKDYIFNVKNKDVEYILAYAIRKNNLDFVKFITEINGNLKINDIHKTIYGAYLHYAVIKNRKEIVKYLLERPDVMPNLKNYTEKPLLI